MVLLLVILREAHRFAICNVKLGACVFVLAGASWDLAWFSRARVQRLFWLFLSQCVRVDAAGAEVA